MKAGKEPMPEAQVVYVIDDDDAVRDSICMLLESYGIAARPYASGAAFLVDAPPEPGCLLIDADMPGFNVPELVDRLRRRGIAMPVIFTTGAPTRRIQAAAAGAGATLLRKPFRSGELLASIADQIC